MAEIFHARVRRGPTRKPPIVGSFPTDYTAHGGGGNVVSNTHFTLSMAAFYGRWEEGGDGQLRLLEEREERGH